MKVWHFALAATLGLAAIGAWLASRPSETIGPVRGLTLGDAPTRARDRFAPGSPGQFRTELSSAATGDDFTLVWTPDRSDEVRGARLEFHESMLVAVRMRLSDDAPEADGPPLVLTEASLLARDRSRGEVQLTWIARGCPTHADELRRRLASQ